MNSRQAGSSSRLQGKRKDEEKDVQDASYEVVEDEKDKDKNKIKIILRAALKISKHDKLFEAAIFFIIQRNSIRRKLKWYSNKEIDKSRKRIINHGRYFRC